MEKKEAITLRKNWGDKPCGHSKLENEFLNGKNTGSKVCASCGREIYASVVDYSTQSQS